MTILVTGATGFVGSAVTRRLLSRDLPVRVLVRPSSNRGNIAGLPVEVAEGDLRDPVSLERALDGCEALFHVAADYRLWVPNPEEMYRTNVDGTRHLLRAARAAGIKRVVYTSSVATLGHDASGAPANEDTPVGLDDMIGHYKRSKFLAEQEVRQLIETGDVSAVIVNPSTPIGPRDIKPTPTGRIIVEAACGRIPAFVDTGLNVVHVDDVGEGHILALEHGRVGERYILGGRDMNLVELLTVIAAEADRRPPRVRLPHALVLPIAYLSEAWTRLFGGEPFVTVDSVRMAREPMFFSSVKAERELGYRARSAEEAIRDAFDWFAARGYLD